MGDSGALVARNKQSCRRLHFWRARTWISEGQERGQDKPDYEANRARISVALSEFTMPLLSRIYHAFEGDMVAAIVLGEIACRVTTADAALRSASLACGS